MGVKYYLVWRERWKQYETSLNNVIQLFELEKEIRNFTMLFLSFYLPRLPITTNYIICIII